MIKAVIFDFGDVILNQADFGITKSFAELLDAPVDKVYEAVQLVRKKYQKGNMDEEEIKGIFFKVLNKRVEGSISEIWSRGYRSNGFIEGNIELVSHLKKNSYKVVCLSNVAPPVAKISRECGDYDIFDFTVLSCEVGMRKPEPEIYLYTLKKLNVKPDECVFIDDCQEFVDAAKKLGLHTVHFKDEEHLREDLKKLGVKVD